MNSSLAPLAPGGSFVEPSGPDGVKDDKWVSGWSFNAEVLEGTNDEVRKVKLSLSPLDEQVQSVLTMISFHLTVCMQL